MRVYCMFTACMCLSLGLAIERPSAQDPVAPASPAAESSALKALPKKGHGTRLGIVPGIVPKQIVLKLELNGFPGVMVKQVQADSPAAKAGLQAGDVIVKVGDTFMRGVDSVKQALADHAPGERVVVEYYRDGNKGQTEAVLDEGPLDEGCLFLNEPEELPTLPVPDPDDMQQGRYPFPGHQGFGVPRSGLSGAAQQMREMQQILQALLLDDPFTHDPMLQGVLPGMQQSPSAAQLLQQLQQMQHGQSAVPQTQQYRQSNMFLQDGEGSVTIHYSGDQGTTVRVTDRAGNVLFEGPYNSPQDLQNMPEEVRRRVQHIQVQHGGM